MVAMLTFSELVEVIEMGGASLSYSTSASTELGLL